MSRPRQLFLAFAIIVLAGGCARLPGFGKSAIKAGSLAELHGQLRKQPPQLDTFRYYGPFEVSRTDDMELRLSDTERYSMDLFAPAHQERTPLVIFLHGYGATKAQHAHQAMHVASWGMLGLTLQLPNTGPWNGNGGILARIVDGLARSPEILDRRIDTRRIVLVGHSFGAASVAGALAHGAPAMGAILLDPAVAENGLPTALTRITKPVMILGADVQVSQAQDRDYYFRYVRAGVFEVSVKDAIHEDAQFPSDYYRTTEAYQITFASALTASAVSLHMTGRFDYAWSSFDGELRNGQLYDAKKK